MVDDDEPVNYHHASKLLEACSNSLENLSVLTETAEKGGPIAARCREAEHRSLLSCQTGEGAALGWLLPA